MFLVGGDYVCVVFLKLHFGTSESEIRLGGP